MKNVLPLMDNIKYFLLIVFSIIIILIGVSVLVLIILFFSDLIVYVYDNFTILKFLK